jgi:cell cycle arrest protein BUB3
MSEVKINEPPSDAISSVRFSTTSSQYLLVSSWDASVRLYDIEANKLRHMYNHSRAVLDCYYKDMNQSFSGGLDMTLKFYDFTSQKETILGTHEQAIKCVHYCQSLNLIITGSWDKYVKLWDPRAPRCVGAYEQPDKVYTLDTCDEKLVVGTANRRIRIWNLNNMSQVESRESSLKFQTRSIRCFPNKQGYVISSIEGRVAVDYFDMNPDVQRKKYAFKCHRNKENGIEIIYPVNAIAFHNVYNTFATGGSDW